MNSKMAFYFQNWK